MGMVGNRLTTNAPQAAQAIPQQAQQPSPPLTGTAAPKQLVKALGEVSEVTEADLTSEFNSMGKKRMSRPRAALITRLSKIFGNKVRFYQWDTLVSDGVTLNGNEVWGNVDAGVDPIAVVGHEWRHTILPASRNVAPISAVQSGLFSIPAIQLEPQLSPPELRLSSDRRSSAPKPH